ncbi:unnamed protein product [Caenorhabditis bovis]|uniref:Uncharacterized protein n=1 Tax=Caenorhabditis bovis TaxID=2654633 RepID=A0A8S1F0T1_9PELO|nr:unnamed protein product [Caenorhabditis bovis]
MSLRRPIGGPTICTINSSLPSYQPNVFICDPGSSCCRNRGNPACCQNDVTARQVLEQLIPFIIMYAIIFITAYMVYLFFSDDETNSSTQSQTSGFRAVDIIFPTPDDYTVEDPVFGKLYSSKAPKLATVYQNDQQMRQRKQEK